MSYRWRQVEALADAERYDEVLQYRQERMYPNATAERIIGHLRSGGGYIYWIGKDDVSGNHVVFRTRWLRGARRAPQIQQIGARPGSMITAARAVYEQMNAWMRSLGGEMPDDYEVGDIHDEDGAALATAVALLPGLQHGPQSTPQIHRFRARMGDVESPRGL